MKEAIHPEWYAEATVVCACGNTWKTGATVPEIRTDICSACHPFFTGEQRIVDTEGQVDRFMKRLQQRDAIRVAEEERVAARTSPNLAMSELGLAKRYVNLFSESGIEIVGEFIAKLEEGGDEALLEIPGIGRKVLADVKRELRNRGYEVPESAS
ncbi:MAG: 50S ribosomal protein L31 [Anaerolineaceae bacterium]|nr:50S ribosomal protein L31 [Anaerolineaceae bacterium]